MKISVILLLLATLPVFSQSSQDVERDLRRIENKIDQLQFDQDQRVREEQARKELAEENRLLALPLDADLRGFLAQKYKMILGDSRLSQVAAARILRQYSLGYAKIQDARNAQRR